MKCQPDVEEKYRELLEAYCINNNFIASGTEGVDKWFKEIFPAEAEHTYRFFKNEYSWVSPPNRLIVTVGLRIYGPELFLYAALKHLSERSGAQGKDSGTPSIYLVVTESTRPLADIMARWLKTYFEGQAPHFEYVEVSRSEIEDIYSKLRDRLFHRGGLPGGTYYVDITGGTKAMSSALLGLAYTASLLSGAKSPFYIFYEEAKSEASCKNAPAEPCGTRIKLQGDPLEIFRDYTINSILYYVRNFAFDRADEITRKALQTTLSPEFKDTLKALNYIVIFTKSLAMLDFSGTIQILDTFSKDIPSGRVLTQLSRKGIHLSRDMLEETVKELNPLKEIINAGNPLSILEKKCTSPIEDCPKAKEYSRALLLLANMLYLVGRAWEAKFPALSVQVYYRAIEMALQAYLLRKGIWAGGKTPINRLEKLGLNKDLINMFKEKAEQGETGELVVKLGLHDDALIINDLEGDFPEFEKLNDYTSPRNKSIIAHGLTPPKPGKGNFNKLRNYVPKITAYIAGKTEFQGQPKIVALTREILGV